MCDKSHKINDLSETVQVVCGICHALSPFPSRRECVTKATNDLSENQTSEIFGDDYSKGSQQLL